MIPWKETCRSLFKTAQQHPVVIGVTVWTPPRTQVGGATARFNHRNRERQLRGVVCVNTRAADLSTERRGFASRVQVVSTRTPCGRLLTEQQNASSVRGRRAFTTAVRLNDTVRVRETAALCTQIAMRVLVGEMATVVTFLVAIPAGS